MFLVIYLSIGYTNALGTAILVVKGGDFSAIAGLKGSITNSVVLEGNLIFSNNCFPGYRGANTCNYCATRRLAWF